MDKAKITSAQFAILTYMYLLGTAAIMQPHTIASIAGTDEWFTMLLSIFAQLGIGWLYMTLAFKYPNETIIEYSRHLLGKWAGWLLGFSYFVFFLVLDAYILRVVSGFLGASILPRTPSDVLRITFLIPVAYGVFLGLGVIGRTTQILLPFTVFIIILSAILLLPQIHADNLLPMFPDGIMAPIKGLYPLIGFPIEETFVLLMLVRFVVDKEKTKKYFYIASAAGPATIMLITLLTIMVLGIEVIVRAPYVVYDLVKEIRIERIFDRVEAIMGIVWMSTTFVKVTLTFYAATIAGVQLFKLVSYKHVIIPCLFLLLPMTHWVIDNTVELEDFLTDAFTVVMFFPGVFFPALLLIVSRFKEGKNSGSPEARDAKRQAGRIREQLEDGEPEAGPANHGNKERKNQAPEQEPGDSGNAKSPLTE